MTARHDGRPYSRFLRTDNDDSKALESLLNCLDRALGCETCQSIRNQRMQWIRLRQIWRRIDIEWESL